MPKHYHRLKPALKQENTLKQRVNKFTFGAAAKALAEKANAPVYFFFDDRGNLYLGQTEIELIEPVKGTFKEPPIIHWMDIENAFNLGRAVAHLEHTDQNNCDPTQLGLINGKMEPNYNG